MAKVSGDTQSWDEEFDIIVVGYGYAGGVSAIEASEAGEAAWVARCLEKAGMAAEFFENCTPGYYNNEGRTSEVSAQNGFYGGGPVEFFALLEAWRKEDALAEMDRR